MPGPDTSFEQPFWSADLLVAGIDEAGRGALAGPVVAAAVIFHPQHVPDGLDDSKALLPAQRNAIAPVICRLALAHAVAFIPHDRIDEVNILQATFDAMHDAIGALACRPDHVLVDGNKFRPHPVPHTTIIHGDARSASIAAASILAKVARDAWMSQQAHNKWPMYGFDKHKGYGTLRHRQAISDHGPCPIHRLTFLRG